MLAPCTVCNVDLLFGVTLLEAYRPISLFRAFPTIDGVPYEVPNSRLPPPTRPRWTLRAVLIAMMAETLVT